MAGETVRTEAICLSIHPWSKTSHVVTWLTPRGRVGTVVKGAVRPKSFFLGQYDLNYTCDVLYYARARGELHALRECAPENRRDALRDDFRALALAGHFRRLAFDYAPAGEECAAWYGRLEAALDALARHAASAAAGRAPKLVASWRLAQLLRFELDVLHLLGLSPEIEAEAGLFRLRGERAIPVSDAVAAYLRRPTVDEASLAVAQDAARVLGVFYQFHLDASLDARRAVLSLL
jgi:recombinational DNA repair protein (RecF pathway)